MTDSGYAEGFYSLLDEKNGINFTHYHSAPHLLTPIKDEWAVQRLQWFSKGFYKVSRMGNDIIISDLRMGVEPLYFFSFAVGRLDAGEIVVRSPRQIQSTRIDMGANMSFYGDVSGMRM